MFSDVRHIVIGALLVLCAVLAFVCQTLRIGLAQKETELVACASERQSLEKGSADQNAAIDDLRKVADDAVKRADDMRQVAEAEALQKEQNAKALRAWKRKAGETDCQAATRLLGEVRR